MEKFLKIGILSIAVIFVFSTFAIIEIDAQRTTEVLRRMDIRYKGMQTLQSNIKMEKYSSQTNESDITSGRIKYITKTNNRAMYVRIDWLNPVEESMSVTGDTYTIYRPKLKQVYTGKTNNAKDNAKAGGALAFLSMSRKELNDNFTFRDLGDETVGGSRAIHLELTPKNTGSYKLSHLWVDKDGVPLMIKVVEKNDDSTTILISDIKLNATLKGEDFEIKYPKSIKPIIN